MSPDNLIYSQNMNSHPWVQVVFVAGKVPCSCHVGSTFDVKNVTFESVSDSVSSLSNISDIATITFLAFGRSHCIMVLYVIFARVR